MPLNQLENFIKNTEGRILYVNPNDLDSTDSIANQGNSLTKPFKTIQRALIESARFSYLRGSNNDITEKTTILLFPGEHVIDNRPGFAIRSEGESSSIYAEAVAPNGTPFLARDIFNLTLTTNFDITQENNVLYKFNSVEGGVIVPRGTSIVGLDLRKVKIRPKYVPNPTDPSAPRSSIFRVTGACYFWQASFFDADELGLVYTDPRDFTDLNKAKPTFSHHKLSCFEYADGVNTIDGYTLTDLEMYYAKLSNAYNEASGGRLIFTNDKYPQSESGFAPQRPEYEIVGAFASDPFEITSIQSGNGLTATNIITVTTSTPHEFSVGTPIKIKGVDVQDYNISTKVAGIDLEDPNKFTYLLPFVRNNLPAFPSTASATVTIETDTVSGASPYVFNVSMRSVWGMNGLLADGKKATGFRSMVTAQFTAVSLQKDDRAFVKYDPVTRVYQGLNISSVSKGSELSSQSSSTDSSTVYHLDPRAVYRSGWESSHHKLTNDAFIQIVSVFAIGFNKHFDAESGGDASITNSNSNFGQFSLVATGYKAEAFDKDNKSYITSIITPRSIVAEEETVDWISLDVRLTKEAANPKHLYIYGFKNPDIKPPTILQQYRLGAKVNDKVYVITPEGTKEANIYLTDNVLSVTGINTRAQGVQSSEKYYRVSSGPSLDTSSRSTVFKFTTTHGLQTGEKVRLFSDDGDLPENLKEATVYYAIKYGTSTTDIQLAASLTNAQIGIPIVCYGGTKLSIVSRVSDKEPGDVGSPIQYDQINSNWFVNTNSSNQIYNTINSLGVVGFGTERTEVSYIKRIPDSRSLDEKLYKIRVVVPKDVENARDPVVGYILQESSSTGITTSSDFNKNTITSLDFDFNKNPKFISKCTVDGTAVTTISELPHGLKVDDIVIIKNVTSTTNLSADENSGYNGTFKVTNIVNSHTFTYETTDLFGKTRNVGTFTNNTNVRNEDLPRFERNDINSNLYIYRSEVIRPYVYGVQDGIYHLYTLNSSNQILGEFSKIKYSQNIVDLYPQLDNDNVDDNPVSAKSFAKRSPLGLVVTNDLKKSITRENIDKVLKDFNVGLTISGVSTSFSTPTSGTATLTFNKQHEFSGIATYSSLTSGSGYNNGTYYNVKLFNFGTSTWDGATAKVVVASGQVSNVEIISKGSAYTNGEFLEFDSTIIGPGSGAKIEILTSGISGDIGDGIQITGIGTTSDGHYKIASIPSKTQVSIAITNFYPKIIVGQYVLPTGPSITISSSSYDAGTNLVTFNFSTAHGLVVGNKFRIFNSSNQNIGDFLVDEKISSTSISAITNQNLSVNGGYIVKHGLSANDAVSDIANENLGTRGLYFYDSEITTLSADVADEASVIRIPVTQSQLSRFSLGSFIQIDNEIMRVASKTLIGSGNNELAVIRGVLGTRTQFHANGTLIKKIRPIPVEFRRPSVLRASGHTFEYLGYGPGNYSTGLPQVQLTTLTETEAFLSQSQQRSCGSVAYTGMNNDGDFFIGNTKYSSTSGEQITFGIPIPTVTGRDPSRLSVVFDEVVIKERLIVEGGNSGTILSQFDGPVTFNGEIRINAFLTINNSVRIKQDLRVDGNSRFEGDVTINSPTDVSPIITSELLNNGSAGAALIVKGGVGILKDLVVSKNVRVVGVSTFTGVVDANGGATIDNIRIGIADDNTIDTAPGTGNLTIDSAGGTVNITDQLIVSGISTFSSLVDANGGATIDNIRIGIAGDNEIDTSTGNLTIDSNGGTVTVDDNLIVTQTLNVTDATVLSDTLNVTGATTLSSTLEVTGATELNSTLEVTGVTTLNNRLYVYGDTLLDEKLTVTDATTLSSTLDVTGTTTLRDDLSIYDNVTIFPVGNALATSSSTTVNSSLLTWRGRRWTGSLSADISWNSLVVPTDSLGNSEWRLRIGTTNQVRVTNNSNVIATTFTGELDGNAGSATILQTTRTLWGQSFNGSANVSGNLTSVGNITGSGSIIVTPGGTNGSVTVNTTGNGSIILNSGSSGGTVRIQPGVSGTRIYNSENSNYTAINNESITANRLLTLADGATTLVPGTMVPTSLTLTAGDGISGGGNLSENRTFDVDSTVVRTSRRVGAGAGLINGGDLSEDRTLAMGTPSSITADSENSTTATSHTHKLASNAVSRSNLADDIAPIRGYIAFSGSGNVIRSKNLSLSRTGTGQYTITCDSLIRTGDDNWGVVLTNIDDKIFTQGILGDGGSDSAKNYPNNYNRGWNIYVQDRFNSGFTLRAKKYDPQFIGGNWGDDLMSTTIFTRSAVDPSYVALVVF